MNRSKMFFIVGFAFIFVSFLPPLLRGEFGYTGSPADRFSNYPPEPAWEVWFIIMCSIIGITLIVIASASNEELLPFIGTEKKVKS